MGLDYSVALKFELLIKVRFRPVCQRSTHWHHGLTHQSSLENFCKKQILLKILFAQSSIVYTHPLTRLCAYSHPKGSLENFCKKQILLKIFFARIKKIGLLSQLVEYDFIVFILQSFVCLSLI